MSPGSLNFHQWATIETNWLKPVFTNDRYLNRSKTKTRLQKERFAAVSFREFFWGTPLVSRNNHGMKWRLSFDRSHELFRQVSTKSVFLQWRQQQSVRGCLFSLLRKNQMCGLSQPSQKLFKWKPQRSSLQISKFAFEAGSFILPLYLVAVHLQVHWVSRTSELWNFLFALAKDSRSKCQLRYLFTIENRFI